MKNLAQGIMTYKSLKIIQVSRIDIEDNYKMTSTRKGTPCK